MTDPVESHEHDTPEAEIEAVETEQVEPQAPEIDEDADEARLFGWKSPDEWQGDKPPGYIEDPKEYLERVKRSRTFKVMEDKIAEQGRKLATVNERALERQRAEYEQRLAALDQMQRKAVEGGDVQTYDRVQEARRNLEAESAALTQPEPQAPDPVLTEFVENNDWAKNPVLWNEAAQIVQTGIDSGSIQTNDPAEQLAFAEQTMRAKYPHLFQQADPQPQRQRVDGGGLAGPQNRGASAYDKLPSEAKQAFARQMKRGVWKDTKKDREEYAREYNNA